MAANTQGETTEQRIERDKREARIEAAEAALEVLGDTLVCSPGEGLHQEIGRENAAQSVKGLAIEMQYRTDRVQCDEAEARQAREAEDEAQGGQRGHEETEGESESESLGGVAMAATSTRPAQEPVVELPLAPGRARSEAKRKATESPPQSRPKKAKGGTKGKGKAVEVEALLWSSDELKDPEDRNPCAQCARLNKPCNGVLGSHCALCVSGHRECNLYKRGATCVRSKSDGRRKQVSEHVELGTSDRGKGPSTRRPALRNMRASVRQGRTSAMSRRERCQERIRLLEERVERLMEGFTKELEEMRMELALLRGEEEGEDDEESE
ncbi:hypothetical protein BD410DRAFT_803446 [Rickenella mellea]|uniref:Uncharacterized protein n=1 Tax=Rickenella mellea TaxID=50990 RepID=A0A4Y7Q4Y7_9AGAM|nr:hypothetical protein BD410DRAFT_803446 [Rickenella mellea]